MTHYKCPLFDLYLRKVHIYFPNYAWITATIRVVWVKPFYWSELEITKAHKYTSNLALSFLTKCYRAIFSNEHCNEYHVNCNEVKVLKNGLKCTSLKVKVFPIFDTSLQVKVLKLWLQYSNALLLLRYCTTLELRYVKNKLQQTE